MKQIYLDNQSGTKLDERVLEAMLPFFKENYANAQSMHSQGQFVKDALEAARVQAAGLINADPSGIIFTSSGSESNNLAVKGVAQAYKQKGKHIVVSEIEHFSVFNAAKRLQQQYDYEVTAVPVDRYGKIDIDALKRAIRPDTVLVSVGHANTEIGTIEPINEIAAAAHSKGALFHTDCVASAGVIAVDVKEINADLLTFSSSQIYGPTGAACLYIKKGTKIVPQIDGGIQESGRRSGTENIPAIIGFGRACELAKAEMSENFNKLTLLRDKLIEEMPKRIEHISLNGHPRERLPNNVNFSVEFVEGEGLLLSLDAKGILVSSGSACASKALKMSHVLAALKIEAALAQGSLLMTFSKYNTMEDVNYVLDEFPAIVTKLRGMSPLYNHFIKTGKRLGAGPGTDFEHNHEHDSPDYDSNCKL